MPDIIKASIDNHQAVARACAELRGRVPDYEITALMINGDIELGSDGGVAYHWIDSGSGEVHLPAGHLTQEGDGDPLPPHYRPVAPPEDALHAFATLTREVDTLPEDVRPTIVSLLQRHAVGRAGEIDSDLTRIRLFGDFATWANEPTAAALRTLLAHADQIGVYERTVGGWEPILPGDLLITAPERPRRSRGNLWLWRIIDRSCDDFPSPYAVRRLRHLRDTAGGCAPGEEPFRRLALPWRLGADGDLLPDGRRNRLNSHAVNIVRRLSRTHVHPDPPVSGPLPQWELYLVIDPGSHGLGGAGRAEMHNFPDPSDFTYWQVTPLQPGDLVVIPPGTAHRGIDVLATVIAIPGFMPTEEVYVDARIAAETGGAAPHNPLFANTQSGSRP